MFRGGSRVWSLVLILCIAGSFVLSSTSFADDSGIDRFADDSGIDRFADDSGIDRFADDSGIDRFSPLSFGSITTELINLASTELITRAACAVLGYKVFSSAFNVDQNTVKVVNIEPVNKSEFSKKVLTSKLAGCNLLLDLGL